MSDGPTELASSAPSSPPATGASSAPGARWGAPVTAPNGPGSAKKRPAKKVASKQAPSRRAAKGSAKGASPRASGKAKRPGTKQVVSGKKPVKKAAARAPVGAAGAPSATRTTTAAGKRSAGGRSRAPVPPRKLQARWVVRLFAPPNIEGPRARMGIVWILFAFPAVYFGPVSTAALYGLHAGIAALQTGQAWRRSGYQTSRLVAAPAAMAMPLLAINSYANPAIVMLALPVVAFVVAQAVPRARRRTSAAATAGTTLRAAVPAGMAATGMVYIAHFEVGLALVFLVLISAYDVGSFIFGAETRSPLPGIVMGAVTSLAFTVALFAVTEFAFKLPPFEGTAASWVFGGMVAVFAPLGQIVASLALPEASTWAPALRRLDSYILAAPLWAWTLWSYLG